MFVKSMEKYFLGHLRAILRLLAQILFSSSVLNLYYLACILYVPHLFGPFTISGVMWYDDHIFSKVKIEWNFNKVKKNIIFLSFICKFYIWFFFIGVRLVRARSACLGPTCWVTWRWILSPSLPGPAPPPLAFVSDCVRRLVSKVTSKLGKGLRGGGEFQRGKEVEEVRQGAGREEKGVPTRHSHRQQSLSLLLVTTAAVCFYFIFFKFFFRTPSQQDRGTLWGVRCLAETKYMVYAEPLCHTFE